MRNANHRVRYARLQAAACDWRENVESNALGINLHNLRRKIGKERILEVRGVRLQLVSTPGS